jgi:hypothetical protein
MLVPFTDEQTRTLVNLRQRYEVWRDAERALRALPYDLRRKRIGEYEYLYEIHDRSGNGTSLDRWDETAARRLDAYRAEKTALKERRQLARGATEESARLGRASRVPMLSSEAGPILREADCRGLLDGDLLVVGTSALLAYSYEAVARLELPNETEDFDLAWARTEPASGTPVWDMLKAVDPTFTVNTERSFQARNAAAYEVELLVAPSRAETRGTLDRPHPIPLPAQEWLLLGRPIDHVAVCRDATSARIVVPDPRWFALQKLWMSAQEQRNPFKRRKDHQQGIGVLDAVAEAMPHYPLDAAFSDSVPAELRPFWNDWRNGRLN